MSDIEFYNAVDNELQKYGIKMIVTTDIWLGGDSFHITTPTGEEYTMSVDEYGINSDYIENVVEDLLAMCSRDDEYLSVNENVQAMLDAAKDYGFI